MIERSASARLANTRTATVAEITDTGPGLRILILAPAEKDFSYKAGQYVWVGFGDCHPRPFSIANAPGKGGQLEIHIKDTGAGGASTYALNSLAPGEAVTLAGPAGGSYFQPGLHEGRPLLLIAGGMGMAPLKAIAENALEKGDRRSPLYFYWGVRQESDFYARDYFEKLEADFPCFRFRPVAAQPVGAGAANDFADLGDFSIFLGGPQAMIDATLPLLLLKGARPDYIHYDIPHS